MAFVKRILFFTLVNILVINSFLIIASLISYFVFGTPFSFWRFSYNEPGGNFMANAAIFAAVLGMGGSFVSLFISKWMAKRAYGIQIIDRNTRDSDAKEILEMVYSMARKAGIKTMPEVGVYQSPDMNAFATGPSKNSSLVAVSTGLLRNMNRNQVEAVLAHEVSHVANGDMVTLALLQGVINSFAYFFAYIVTNIITSQMERDSYWVRMILHNVLINLFVFLGMPVVMFFSRWREYRADAGAARYSGAQNMISALQALQRNYFPPEMQKQEDSFAAFKISSPKTKGGFWALYKSHPDLDDRIARLQKGRF